ncbi:MAG: hypothetical protein QNJ98_17915, partial [Planctomycetota bacterium]|nr:hypothetical protein [Planctomycetota bacterium]
MSRPGRCLLPLLLLLSFSAADAGPPKAKPGAEGPWKVGPNDFVHYQLDVERFGRGEQPNTTPGEPLHNAFGLFGYEIQDGERPMRALFNEEWLVFNYVLWMPERLTRKGRSIAIRDDPVEYGRQHATVRGRGKLSAAAERKTEDTHEVDLVGSVVFETAPDPEYVRGGKTPKGSGRLTWQATFDLEEGLMRRAEFALSVDDAGYGTYPNGSGARKERRITFEGTLVLHKRLPYRYPGFEREVGKAIERGMEGIRAKRDDLGVWSKQGYYPMGRTSLGLLALVKGGWDRSDESLAKIVEWLLAQEPESTYSVGLALAAIEAYRAPDRELGLGEKKADSEHGTRTLTKDERRFAETLTDYLVENGQIGPVTPRRGAAAPEGRRKRRGRGATSGEEYIRWGYPGRHRNAGVEVLGGGDASDYWDNSNSQYAVLGLHSASLSGVEVPRHVWFKVLGHFLRHQRLDGPPRPHLELKDAKDGTTRYATSSR